MRKRVYFYILYIFYTLIVTVISVKLVYPAANSYKQIVPLNSWMIQQQEKCKKDQDQALTTLCALNSWLSPTLRSQIAQSTMNLHLKAFDAHKSQVQLTVAKETNAPYINMDLFLEQLGLLQQPVDWQAYLNPSILNKGVIEISYPLMIASRQIIEFIGLPAQTQFMPRQLEKVYPAQLTAVISKEKQVIDIDIQLDIAKLALVHMSFHAQVDGVLSLSPLLADFTEQDVQNSIKNKVYPSEFTLSLTNTGLIEDIVQELLGDQSLIYSPMLLMHLSDYFTQIALLQRDQLLKRGFISLADFILLPRSLSIKAVNNYGQQQSFSLWQDILDWLNFDSQWQTLTLKQQEDKSSALQQEIFKVSAQRVKYKNKLLALFKTGFSYQFFSNGVEVK
ncbi:MULTISPECIES: hypothetical protein [Cysteiniphilum]|uniref:Uncharacterized protein n=1 Tax=Cysteiniphilum litorale TaxID=2056700 RepID=A0A8J2Z6I0_9GAMM|nr:MULTISPECIES: hypothetical protein [Cysteiniphilum]GGG05240.1 hypothetical protein GCM10010995_23420 [Cysteiniphilum litorale]